MSESEWAAFCFDGTEAWWTGYEARRVEGRTIVESCPYTSDETRQSFSKGWQFRDIEERNLGRARLAR
jgi:ribosome modulation factor